MVAVRMKELASALNRLDPPVRALLDVSMRRGVSDREVAYVMRTDTAEVAARREEALERLAGELGLDGREERDELFATLRDLPSTIWDS